MIMGSAEKRSSFQHYPGEMTMKLTLLFIVMDLLTLLALPFIYLHGKIHQFLNSKVNYYNKNKTAAARRLSTLKVEALRK